MWARDRPDFPGANSIPTLVAMTTESRLPLCLSHFPMTVSEMPGCPVQVL